MILDTIHKTIRVVLGEAKTTNDCDITASYADQTGAGFLPANSNGVTNGVTPVTLVTAPGAQTQRSVQEITFHNNDTVTHQVTLQLDDNGTIRIFRQSDVPPGGDFFYSPDSGGVSSVEPALLLESGTIGSKISALPAANITSSNAPGGVSNYTGAEPMPIVLAGATVGVTLNNLALILSNYPYGNIAGTSPFDAASGSNGDGTEVYFNAGSGDGTGQGAVFAAYGGNAGTTGNGGGGGVQLFGGGGQGTGVGGGVQLGAGQANGTGNGGQINITAGSSVSGGNGGSVLLTSGGSNNVSGQVLIQSSNTSNAQSGDVLFGSGNDSGSGNTGQVTIKAGSSASGTVGNIVVDGNNILLRVNQSGGAVKTDDQTGSTPSANLPFTTGFTASGASGNLSLQTGDSSAGNSGNVTIASGAGAGAGNHSGDVVLSPGAVSGGATQGNVKFGAASSFTANGAVATALTGIGPTGAHATVQEWLTIKNPSGTTRYIPCF